MTPFKKYLLITLVLALLNAAVILVFFFPRYEHTDTPLYISAIENIAGDKSVQIDPFRILKPLPILIGAFLTNFTEPENTLAIQNVFFYFLTVILVYYFVWRLYVREKQAFYGSVLFMTAFPFLAFGLASLTDLPGWFFFLFTAFLSLNFLKRPNLKTAILPGLVAGFGMLFKESVAAAPIFFASLVFIAAQLPFKEKIKYILTFGLAFLIFPAINSVILYNTFSYSYLDAFLYAGAGNEGLKSFYMYTPPRIIIEMVRVFSLGWVFILLGVKKEVASLQKDRWKILLSFVPAFLSVFLWSSPHNRMFFIGFPLLVLLGSFGILRNFKSRKLNLFVEGGLLSLYVILHYVVLDFLLDYGIYFWRFGDLSY